MKREVGWNVDVAPEKWVEILTHQEAYRSKHANTTMLDFNLAIEANLALCFISGKAYWVEETKRPRNASEVFDVELWSCWSLGHICGLHIKRSTLC